MSENKIPQGGIPMMPNGPQPGTPVQPVRANPLTKHFRQPKLYLKLPSGGSYWPEGSLELPENGEVPVYPMTAKDELVLKTPDALINGESTATMIQSCIPNIKNAYDTPSLDLDAILIAVRIATYGEKLTITSPVPNTEMTKDVEVDLIMLLDTVQGRTYDPLYVSNGFTFNIRPLNYRQFTKTALKAFEEQRMMQTIADTDLSEEEKMKKFNQSFGKLTSMTLDAVVTQMDWVQFGAEDKVSDKKHILEFFEQTSGDIFDGVKKSIEHKRNDHSLKPLIAQASDEEKAAGAPDTWEVPVSFDQSNFFVRK
jgi:hypothetical protein